MTQVKGTAHTLICHACNQRKPRTGFRGLLCADCCKRDLARFDAGRLVNALHLLLGLVPRSAVARVSEALSEPGFDACGSDANKGIGDDGD